MNRAVGLFVRLFERVIPDPFLFAIILTFITAALALFFAPQHGAWDILSGWYNGIFDPKTGILSFAIQMILVLVTGYALATAPPVRRALEGLAAVARTPGRAIVITIVISMSACWINWGFGLVVAAIIAREMAKRVRMDFGWLVAGAYSGFLVWASGPSSSIALAQATVGSPLNIVYKNTGALLPLSQTVFTVFNLLPVAVLFVVIPLVFRAMQPAEGESIPADVDKLLAEDASPPSDVAVEPSFATRLENAWILNMLLVIAGTAYLAFSWIRSGVHIDINTVIFIFLLAGLLLHARPIAYVGAMNRAARVTGPLLLQYPFYGGIMGIMSGTGLAAVIAAGFVHLSTAATLPFWSYVASIFISLFVPSGGGHWAVQGPLVVPAASALHASQAACAMAVAMGEEVANMIQPFWALPLIAIAGIGIRRVMGYTVISFLVSFFMYGISLLAFAR